MTRPRLIIASGREKSLQRRHPWIFSGAVARIEGSPAEGDIVDVCAADGAWLATGHYQNESIICKVLSYDTPHIDDAFLSQRIGQAVNLRERMAPCSGICFSNGSSVNGGVDGKRITNVFRLINGEGDYMPGLIADYYAGVLVVQTHSMGMRRLLPLLVPLLKHALGDRLVAVFDKSSLTLPGADVADGFIFGDAPADREVMEDGIRLMVNFYEGQKTGFFIDQRENRHLVGSLAAGRRVLNCFGYTGGFSLAAIRGGAEYVETVDISRRAIELCERNVSLNFGANACHKGVVADVLKHLDTIDGNYDMIVLDPPAFAKNHRSLQQGLKGYRNINTKAMQHIKPGGLLFTFSCSQAVSADDFRTMTFSSAALARREVRLIRVLPHATDHPVSIFHPEGEYLKGLLLQVL